jgi:hypothetical protein
VLAQISWFQVGLVVAMKLIGILKGAINDPAGLMARNLALFIHIFRV